MGRKKLRGRFLTFEGAEGAGKSTLIREVARYIGNEGRASILTREPGGTPFAEKVRELILSTQMSPWAELFLYEAGRAEHVEKLILPALNRGEFVLCDRFADSTLAYQAHARGLNWKKVKTANDLATQGLRPDLTVFLDIDPALGLSRVRDRNRFEAEGLAFHKKVQAGYRKAQKTDPKRWLILKVGTKTPQELGRLVLDHLFKKGWI